MKTLRYRTEASARRILAQRWKTALHHHRIPAGTQFRTAVEALAVNPKNTTMTRALLLVDADGMVLPGLRGGVPFTLPKRKRQKTERPATTSTVQAGGTEAELQQAASDTPAPAALGPDADEEVGSPVPTPPLAASAADETTAGTCTECRHDHATGTLCEEADCSCGVDMAERLAPPASPPADEPVPGGSGCGDSFRV